MKRYFLPIILIISFCNIFAQEEHQQSDPKMEGLQTIYSNLEYNTIAFDDLKLKWFVSDPLLVRDIFNKFVVNNALRINGKPLTQRQISEKAQKIYDGEVLIQVRKRYYDNEIEYFAFIPASEIDNENPALLVDPVEAPYYLRTILGDNIYEKIQNRTYFYRNVTKDVFQVRTGYYFDLYLNLIEPKVMFWSTTSRENNKYLLSFFGQWGSYYNFIPGWYYPEYQLGLKLTYYEHLSDDPGNYVFDLGAGSGVSVQNPYLSARPDADLMKSGDNFYFHLSGQPFRYLFPSFRYFFLDANINFTFRDYTYSDYELDKKKQFKSFRNFIVLKLRKERIVNLFNFGELNFSLGVSTHDVSDYALNPANNSVTNLNNTNWMNRFKHYIISELGIHKCGSLLQYDLAFTYGNNIVDNYHFIGGKGKVMLSNTIGLLVEFAMPLNIDIERYDYRTDNYIVFSPVIRINY